MKNVIHNKRARFAALTDHFVAAGVEVGRVSDVKRDGTIIVSFLSTPEVAATEAVTTFCAYLKLKEIGFTRVEDVKVRMPLPMLLSEPTSDPFGFDSHMRGEGA